MSSPLLLHSPKIDGSPGTVVLGACVRALMGSLGRNRILRLDPLAHAQSKTSDKGKAKNDVRDDQTQAHQA